MRSLGSLALFAVAGVVVLSATIPALDPRIPLPLTALYNVWLLATVAIVVATLITLCVRFFDYITGGR